MFYKKRIECVLLAFKGSLICFGGQQESGTATNTMYSLNLSLSWNTSDPAWKQMQSDPSDITYPVSFFAATYLPASHYFVVNGGTCDTSLQSFKKQTYYYDALNDRWELPMVKGMPLAAR
jgi:hypothetical protein